MTGPGLGGGLLDLIRAARRPERSITVCLRGDLVGQYRELDTRLRVATSQPDDSYGGSGEARRIAEQMEDLGRLMRESEVTLRLRALGPTRTLDLVAGHPPLPADAGEGPGGAGTGRGFNATTYFPALIRACCYALVRGEETLDLHDDEGHPTDAMTEADWERLFDALSSQQYDELATAAWNCDHEDIEVPTSPLAWLISQRTDESSTSHSAGEQARSGSSKGGSRRGSRSTSTTTPHKGQGDSSGA